MITYWDRGCEWMGDGLQLAICPSFTGATSTLALDVSGNANHGTLTNMDRNAAWVTSGGKGALNFTNQLNVQQNRVDANSFTLANRNVFSFSGFGFLASRTAGFGNGFFSWGNIGVYTTDCFLYVDGTGPLVLQVNNSSDGGAVTTSNFPLGSWVHVAAVFNGNGTGNSGRIQLYINGRVQDLTFGSYTVPSATSAATGTVFRIGGYLDSITSTAYQWNGQLDDLRIYSRVLTPEEIWQLYDLGRGGGMLYRPPIRRYETLLANAYTLIAASASYSITGQPVGLLAGRLLTADAASYLLAGNATGLNAGRLLTANSAAYALTGQDANLLAGRLLSGDTATYNLIGNSANLLAFRTLQANSAQYTITGSDAALLAGRLLDCGSSAFLLSPNQAGLLAARKLTADQASLLLTTQATNLYAGRKITAETAQFILIASPVDLIFGGGGAAPYYYLFLLGGSR